MKTLPIASILQSFQNKRIAIIGDIMLDTYIFGHISRISPEYPVPVVDVTHEDHRLGGAANVALNTASLGAETILIGLTGTDRNQETLLQLLNAQGLDHSCIIADPTRPTTTKTRILSQNHHITRVDRESRHDIDHELEQQIKLTLEQQIPLCDAIILEDYNKGLLTVSLIQHTISVAREHNVPVLVDPKQKNFFAYNGCSIFKPNLSEIASSLGIAIQNNDNEVEKACLSLREKMSADCIMVTRSEKGMTCYDGTFTHIAACSFDVADVSGAGDTVIGVLGLGVASGLDMVTNARVANLAAATVCQEVGAVPVKADKLLKLYREHHQ